MIYRFARAVLRAALHGFFREVRLHGAENIPPSGPVLLVANHTNAFVDPLLVLTGVQRRVTLTAKAKLASNPLLAPLLHALGVILFSRRTDAVEVGDLRRNDEAMAACVRRLRGAEAVFVFPEGVSHSDPAMRPFRTGAARIVARYLAEEGTRELWIVPIGLHFTRKDRWRSNAVALVGDAVGARAWARAERARRISARSDAGTRADADAGLDARIASNADLDARDKTEALDLRALTAAMRTWIEALTVNFSCAEERDLIADAERLLTYRREGPTPLDRLTSFDAAARVNRIHRLQRGAHALLLHDANRFGALAQRTRSLARTLDELGVDALEVGLPMHPARVAMFVIRELEVLIIGAPIALWGWLVHLLPCMLTRGLIARMSEDEDHPASNAVFLSIPIFAAWWLLILIAAALLLPAPWPIVFASSLPLSATVLLRYRDRIRDVRRRIRTFLLWLRNPGLRKRLEIELCEWRDQVAALEQMLDRADAVLAARA